MECPVCYESKTLCTFTCGHSFCHTCTKSWYNQGSSSCPMCRKSLCFKGFTKLKKKWFREKQEQVYLDLITQMTNELREEYLDVMLMCITVVQNRFEYVMSKYPEISCEELSFVLRVTWIDVDVLMNDTSSVIYEPKTFMRYIFVNGTEYGVKNLSHSYHMMNIMSKDGKLNASHAANRCKL